jgi:hypothetical protein
MLTTTLPGAWGGMGHETKEELMKVPCVYNASTIELISENRQVSIDELRNPVPEIKRYWPPTSDPRVVPR